jgi:peptidoglycan/LPS O-acetylase OafA/YrhL
LRLFTAEGTLSAPSAMSKSNATYRPDIDGLRAIAVLAVVLYHAFPGILPGGFVGVDVFFVISGFLITGILLAEHEKHRFSLARFYARRIRRLFPSLCVVLLACLGLGWFLLFPDEYRQLGKHVFAGAGFGSNVLLWRETGYFDTEAESKPLLHLWSLGIEEQFYLVWPLVLALVVWRGARVLPVLITLALGSFALNLKLTGSAAAFYLPFPRGWELFTGAILACLAARDGKLSYRGASWAGFVLLLVGLAAIDRSRAFPGLWVLLPVMGTAFVILGGPTGFINQHLLSRRALVGVGLISYPLYLWHWPLLAFARIIYSDTPPPEVRALLVAASFALAYATYRWVEKPLRFGARSNRIPVVLCAGLAALAAFGLVLVRRAGVPGRYGPEPTDLIYNHKAFPYAPCDRGLADRQPGLVYCFQSAASPPARVVFGDSHGDHLFAGLAATDHEHVWLMAGHPSCPPVAGVNVRVDEDHCQQRSEQIIDYLVATPSIRTVVLAYFGGYTQDTDYAADHVASRTGPSTTRITAATSGTKSELLYQGLDRAIAALERAGKRVVVVLDIPELPFVPRACLARSALLPPALTACELPVSVVQRRQLGPRQLVAKLTQAHPALLVFDPLETLCTAGTCRIQRDGHLVYRDSHHLSAWGSQQLARVFLAWLATHSL